MKIVDVETFALSVANPAGAYWGKSTWGGGASEPLAHWEPYRTPSAARMRPAYAEGFDTTLVRVTTDRGLVGWGEAKAPVAPRVTKAIIDDLLAEMIIGADPRKVQPLWETMYASMRLRGHASSFFLEAISGVDIALWDIAGQAAQAPIHQLLGGAYRTRIPVYASGVPATLDRPGEADHDRMLAAAADAEARGFRGLKVAIGRDAEADVASVDAIRAQLGDDYALFADAAGNYDVPTAVRVGRELSRRKIGFFEAPLPPEFIDGYAEVARAVDVPIASDLVAQRYHVVEYLKRRALQVVQPDVCRVGGITETHRIGIIADAFGVACTPHVSIGSAIHFAASFHVAAALPNLVRHEYWMGDNPLGDSLLVRPAIAQSDGFVDVPSGPGLGIEIDEEAVRRFAATQRRAS